MLYLSLLESMLISLSILFLTALDTVRVLVWKIPDGGLTETLREPEFKLQGVTSYNVALFSMVFYRTS